MKKQDAENVCFAPRFYFQLYIVKWRKERDKSTEKDLPARWKV